MSLGPTIFNRHVLTLDETLLLETVSERSHHLLAIMERPATQKSDRRHRRLLRRRRERPRHRCTAEKRDELPYPHSITSSARRMNDSGIVMPAAFAVLRLMTNSNLTACSTGKSAGLVPCKIRCT